MTDFLKTHLIKQITSITNVSMVIGKKTKKGNISPMSIIGTLIFDRKMLSHDM